MADVEYPQRWLKEHKAVASEEGWRRPTTKELLKCQKGLDVIVPPVLKNVTISGLERETLISETETGDLILTINYVTDEPDYVHQNLRVDVLTLKGNLSTYVVDEEAKTVTINLKHVEVEDGERLGVRLIMDNIISNIINTTLMIDRVNPVLKAANINWSPNKAFFSESSPFIKFTIPFTYIDRNAPVTKKEIIFEYTGNATLTYTIGSSRDDNIATIRGEGNLVDGEVIKFYIDIDGVKSNTMTTVCTNNGTKQETNEYLDFIGIE